MRANLIGQILDSRYKIEAVLGQGGMGCTYQAFDLEQNRPIAVKALSLHRAESWKAMELFERESNVLKQLDHPAIPKYLDYFEVDTDADRAFYLVQSLAPGRSLLQWIEAGWRPTESEVRAIAQQILKILDYLQEFTPAIIHRDLKPQNLIRQDDGQIFLVDFGAVQDVYRHTIGGGSTVVGTFGYMAPEQFRGEANLSTDLYGLGTTLLFLLTGQSPLDLPQRRLKIDVRKSVTVERNFAAWLDRLVSPDWHSRLPSAKAALSVLEGRRELSDYPVNDVQAVNSLLRITEMSEAITIEVRPRGYPSLKSIAIAMLYSVANGLMLSMFILLGNDLLLANLLLSLPFLLFIVAYERVAWKLFQAVLLDPISYLSLRLERSRCRFERQIGKGTWRFEVASPDSGPYCYFLYPDRFGWGSRLMFQVEGVLPFWYRGQQDRGVTTRRRQTTKTLGRAFGSTLSPGVQRYLLDRVDAYVTEKGWAAMIGPPAVQSIQNRSFKEAKENLLVAITIFLLLLGFRYSQSILLLLFAGVPIYIGVSRWGACGLGWLRTQLSLSRRSGKEDAGDHYELGSLLFYGSLFGLALAITVIF